MSQARRILAQFIDAIQDEDRHELDAIADAIVDMHESEACGPICTFGEEWTGEDLPWLQIVDGGEA